MLLFGAYAAGRAHNKLREMSDKLDDGSCVGLMLPERAAPDDEPSLLANGARAAGGVAPLAGGVDELDLLIDDILGAEPSPSLLPKMSASEARVHQTIAALQEKAGSTVSSSTSRSMLRKHRSEAGLRTAAMLPDELHELGRAVLGDAVEPVALATARIAGTPVEAAPAASKGFLEVQQRVGAHEARAVGTSAPQMFAPVHSTAAAALPDVCNLVKRFEVSCPTINGSYKPSPPRQPVVPAPITAARDDPSGGRRALADEVLSELEAETSEFF